MKLIGILFFCYFNLVQIIDSRMYYIDFNDEMLTYPFDKSVPPYTEYMSMDNLVLEKIDDQTLLIGGYVEFLNSLNRNLPYSAVLTTQYLEHGTWRDGFFKLMVPDVCPEFVNPMRSWYNVTKLWTSNICPWQKGDKWMIEEQKMNITFNLPSSTPIGTWRGYFLGTQGVPGFKTTKSTKFGAGFQLELLELY